MDRLSVIYHHLNLSGREETGHLAVFAEDVMGMGLRNYGFGGLFFFLQVTTEQDSLGRSLKEAE